MASYYPSLGQVRSLAGRGRTVPIIRPFLADQLTPVAAFARVCSGADHAFLLESVVGGERIARYSFVGAEPAAVFRARPGTASVERIDGTAVDLGALSDPLSGLGELLGEFAAVPREEVDFGRIAVPRFTGGAVGYAGYDTVRYYEDLPNTPSDDRGLDDLEFGVYDRMAIFDHVSNTILVVAHCRLDEHEIDRSYAEACGKIDETVHRLSGPAVIGVREFDPEAVEPAEYTGSCTQEQFQDSVRRSIEYIRAGDIFQVVLSRRLRVDSPADPFDVYRALRVINPSPFMFYVKSPRCVLVGASPEILCRVEDGVITNRPLAGTRPRGSTPNEDAALERELLADPKDRAEHIMLVDLARNDVGRVAEPGTVTLEDVMTIERYSHVMHICSNVSGRLAKGRTAMDALRAALPVGTVSGAPKVRAMQIIDELESVRRGPYGGAVGYMDFSGNMDTCIALRTIVATPADRERHWTFDAQSGAGIVAESRPEAEYEETLSKAQALLLAIRVAEVRGDT
ncbi:MAG: anthranilate synthase component I [Planctomycetota bacterium]|nr:anthranilate synthase component I [Planctomycetota bacterium]